MTENAPSFFAVPNQVFIPFLFTQYTPSLEKIHTHAHTHTLRHRERQNREFLSSLTEDHGSSSAIGRKWIRT